MRDAKVRGKLGIFQLGKAPRIFEWYLSKRYRIPLLTDVKHLSAFSTVLFSVHSYQDVYRVAELSSWKSKEHEWIAGGPGVTNPTGISWIMDYVFVGDAWYAVERLLEGDRDLPGLYNPKVSSEVEYNVEKLLPMPLSYEDMVLSVGCQQQCDFCVQPWLRPYEEQNKEAIERFMWKRSGKRLNLLSNVPNDLSYYSQIVELSHAYETIVCGGNFFDCQAGMGMSERLRSLFSKPLYVEDMRDATGEALKESHYCRVCLLLNLPTENSDDFDEFDSEVRRIFMNCCDSKYSGWELLLSFVPYHVGPHTPLQWEPIRYSLGLRNRVLALRGEFIGTKATGFHVYVPEPSGPRKFFEQMLAEWVPITPEVVAFTKRLPNNSELHVYKALCAHAKLGVDAMFEEKGENFEFPWDFVKTNTSKAKLWKKYQEFYQRAHGHLPSGGLEVAEQRAPQAMSVRSLAKKGQRIDVKTSGYYIGDAYELLGYLPDESIHCVVTSPPYWGMRDYGVDGQMGLEASIDEFLAKMVGLFAQVRAVLRPDGLLFLNIGDCYVHSRARDSYGDQGDIGCEPHGLNRPVDAFGGLAEKNLLGMGWRLAFAMQEDGWILRSDIVWCLSGGTMLYAKTQKGVAPRMLKDLVKLDPTTVELWTGSKWTKVWKWTETDRGAAPIELELRSGERIGCTVTHLWPTQRGNVKATELRVGDVIRTTTLPASEDYSPRCIGNDMAWLFGLFLAEGSYDSKLRLQFAGHVDQTEVRLERLDRLSRDFGGTTRVFVRDLSATIIVDCPAIAALVQQYIHGRCAAVKGLRPRCWRHSNGWLSNLMRGYLDGDGHHDVKNNRWRLGFTRNDRLASDLRTLTARVGGIITLKATHGEGFGRKWAIYRGEFRFEETDHHNTKDRSEIVRIGRSRARHFWDVSVEDEMHLFALASGVLTHNSKPNPLPESVRDRPTRAHEYIFMFSKAPKYFYDQSAIREPVQDQDDDLRRIRGDRSGAYNKKFKDQQTTANYQGSLSEFNHRAGKNKRDVWTIASEGVKEKHYATFPTALARTCILAGTSEHGVCSACGAPWRRIVEKGEVVSRGDVGGTKAQEGIAAGTLMAVATSRTTGRVMEQREHLTKGWEPSCDCEEKPHWTEGRFSGESKDGQPRMMGPPRISGDFGSPKVQTTGWDSSCDCNIPPEPAIVLDPFMGSGTVAIVCEQLGRRWIGFDLDRRNLDIANRRFEKFGIYPIEERKVSDDNG